MRNTNALRDAYVKANRLEIHVDSAVKDESETQKTYSAWMQTARELGQYDPVFSNMANVIEGIARQERDHQMRFQQMQSEITKAEGKIMTLWSEALEKENDKTFTTWSGKGATNTKIKY